MSRFPQYPSAPLDDELSEAAFPARRLLKTADTAYLNLRIALQAQVPRTPTRAGWIEAQRQAKQAWRQAPVPPHLRRGMAPDSFEELICTLKALVGFPPRWSDAERIQISAHLWTHMFLFAPQEARAYHAAIDALQP